VLRHNEKEVVMRGLCSVCALLLLVGGCSDDTGPTSDGPAHQEAAVDHGVDGPLHDGPLADGPGGDLPAADAGPDGPLADASWLDGTFPNCTAVSGKCTPQRWIVCPVNTEPVEPDPHQDCGDGWCCVAAPASTCSANPGTNCVFGSTCTGCWAAPANTSLTCEAGRVCCEDICD
jgi:hypothetical protein